MRTGRRSGHLRAGALLLALLLLLSACLSAQAEEADEDVTLALAQSAVDSLDLTDAAGQPLRPRQAPEMLGRGNPDVAGEEPDYRGIVGYMALQNHWDVSRFNTFSEVPWLLPEYRRDGDNWQITGTIQ